MRDLSQSTNRRKATAGGTTSRVTILTINIGASAIAASSSAAMYHALPRPRWRGLFRQNSRRLRRARPSTRGAFRPNAWEPSLCAFIFCIKSS